MKNIYLMVMLLLAIPGIVTAEQFNWVSITVPEGTDINVVLTRNLNTEINNQGDPVIFRVMDDVIVCGVTVIKFGSLLEASIKELKRKGKLGMGGRIVIEQGTVKAVDHTEIPVAISTRSGQQNNVAGMLLPVAGYMLGVGPLIAAAMQEGKSAEIKKGTEATVYTSKEVTIVVPFNQIPAAARGNNAITFSRDKPVPSLFANPDNIKLYVISYRNREKRLSLVTDNDCLVAEDGTRYVHDEKEKILYKVKADSNLEYIGKVKRISD